MPDGNSASTETIDKNVTIKGNLVVEGSQSITGDPQTIDDMVVGGFLTVAETADIVGAATAASIAVGGGSALAKYLTASASLNFGVIATTASADLTIGVTGAAVGDNVALGLQAAPDAGIVFMAFVSASDVVTVRAMNITGTDVNPASATYRVAVFK